MAAKKKATRKKVAKKATKRDPKKPLTKSEIFAELAEKTNLSRVQVRSVFDELSAMVGKNLASRGPGQFTVPGLCKMTVKVKPAKKARKGINPFTGEETIFKAKPRSKAVQVRPIKALKDMVS